LGDAYFQENLRTWWLRSVEIAPLAYAVVVCPMITNQPSGNVLASPLSLTRTTIKPPRTATKANCVRCCSDFIHNAHTNSERLRRVSSALKDGGTELAGTCSIGFPEFLAAAQTDICTTMKGRHGRRPYRKIIGEAELIFANQSP
jgi:hypothetical protein